MKEVICLRGGRCIHLQIEKGYRQIIVHPRSTLTKTVQYVAYFCGKKDKFLRRKDKYGMCPHKQTRRLEDYDK